MLLLDLTHTSHTRAQTGIQQVARALHGALPESAGVTWDHHAGQWRPLDPWEHANLAARGAAGRRSAHWPWSARLRGAWRKVTGTVPVPPPADALVVPELFFPATAAAFPALFRAVRGPKIALFHDAIALRLPEHSPARTVARFPAYLQELLAFDGIAAVSADSRDTLLDYWRWLGVKNPPPVAAIPLGLAPAPVAPGPPPAGLPVVLSVGTIEGRKNHLALLAAAAALWQEGLRFELHLVGLAQAETGRAALTRIRALQAAGHPLRYDGPVDQAALEDAYRRCTFTVYPSLMEGFGLPVLESLARGRPCICSGRGALGESTRDGGCLALAAVDVATLTAALRRLLITPAETAQLAAAARARHFRTWKDYAADLTGWLQTLRRA
jgi:glycosyltransferase involved in cell wall biosynthesis